jgi:hypothetical protein
MIIIGIIHLIHIITILTGRSRAQTTFATCSAVTVLARQIALVTVTILCSVPVMNTLRK